MCVFVVLFVCVFVYLQVGNISMCKCEIINHVAGVLMYGLNKSYASRHGTYAHMDILATHMQNAQICNTHMYATSKMCTRYA